MKVCVTGASGFIGQRLVLALNQQNHNVTVLSRNKNKIFPKGTQVVIGDLTDDNCELESLLDNCDVIFHCAGEIQKTEMMRALHVDGTQRLIQAVYKQNKQRKKPLHWVQLSSVGVYGPPSNKASQHRIITEESPLLPKGEYEVTKAEADEIIINAEKRSILTYSIIRPSNIFGEKMPSNALRSLIHVVRKRWFFYIGEKGAVAPYIHVDDVVNVLIQCGLKPAAKGEVFNLSFDLPFEEMIAEISLKLDVRKPWCRLPEIFVRSVIRMMKPIIRLPLTQDGVNLLVSKTQYPCSKLEQKLGFKPSITVADRLNELVEENNEKKG